MTRIETWDAQYILDANHITQEQFAKMCMVPEYDVKKYLTGDEHITPGMVEYLTAMLADIDDAGHSFDDLIRFNWTQNGQYVTESLFSVDDWKFVKALRERNAEYYNHRFCTTNLVSQMNK